ncbi:MAG: hypothetical protein WCA81_12805 [Rhizomicrobium sp.]
MNPKLIVVNDSLQRGYRYELIAPMGKRFDPVFKRERFAGTL